MKTEYVGVSVYLLKDCVRVDLRALRTNGDMARALLAQDASIDACNADKAAIREITKEIP